MPSSESGDAHASDPGEPGEASPIADLDAEEAGGPEAVRLWGTEYPKLSGPGWRRAHGLERVQPVPDPAEPGESEEPQEPPDLDEIARAFDQTQRATLERLDSLDTSIAQIARSLSQAAWMSSAADLQPELDQLRAAIADIVERARAAQEPVADRIRAESESTRALIQGLGEEIGTLSREQEASRRAHAEVEEERARFGAEAEAVEARRTQGLDRIANEVKALARSLAEFRNEALAGTAVDELGRLVQSEGEALRQEVARARDLSANTLQGRLDLLQQDLSGVARSLAGLSARLDDLPQASALTDVVRSESDRARADLQSLGTTLRAMFDELRARTERMDAELTDISARFDASRGDPDRLVATLREESEALREQLVRAAEATDARARGVLSAIAREVTDLSGQQRELREELRRLAARIVGRPVI